MRTHDQRGMPWRHGCLPVLLPNNARRGRNGIVLWNPQTKPSCTCNGIQGVLINHSTVLSQTIGKSLWQSPPLVTRISCFTILLSKLSIFCVSVGNGGFITRKSVKCIMHKHCLYYCWQSLVLFRKMENNSSSRFQSRILLQVLGKASPKFSSGRLHPLTIQFSLRM